jgi:hypothetical protein
VVDLLSRTFSRSRISQCESGGLPNHANLETGGIVGIAEIVDCVTGHSSKWFEGPFGFVLRKRRPLPFVKWTGALGLRDAPKTLLRRIEAALRLVDRQSAQDYLG